MAKHPADSRREAVCAWLTANGINPNHVPNDADMAIRTIDDESRVIAYEAFVVSEDGHPQADQSGTGVARVARTVPLLVDPPEWWEPYEKPTRDQLLAVVGRVHALHRRNEHTGDCEHCSQHDYPDYSVSWPCATVQALS